MPDRQSNFDTEIEKKAYEFMVNWLHWNIAFTEYYERKYLRGPITAQFVNNHKKFADDAMLDMFETLQQKYGAPGEEDQNV